MKSSMQWSPVYGLKDFRLERGSNPKSLPAGIFSIVNEAPLQIAFYRHPPNRNLPQEH